MPPLAEAFVRIRPDTSTFAKETEQGIKKGSKGVGDRTGKEIGTRIGVGMHGPIASAVSRSAKLFAAGFAAIKVGGFLKDAIGAASDLNETMSKTQNVFGASTKSIVDWSKQSSTSFGLSQQAALAAASQFGDMFHQLGFTQKQSATTSKSLVKMAADLGSFHNVDPSDVLDRIGGALRGEYDSLQQLIPNISAARVQQEALRQTHKKSVNDLTAAEKATATLAIIQKDGANAANDFAETSGGLANQQRILSARFADIKASIGRVALPLVTKFFSFLTATAIPALGKVGSAFKLVLGDDGAQGFSEVMDNALGNTGRFVPVFLAVGNGIRQLVFGFRAMITAFKEGDVTSDGFVGAMEKIGVQARAAFGFFQSFVLPVLKTLASILVGSIIPALIDFGGWLVRSRSWLLPLAAGIAAVALSIKIVTTALKVWAAVTKIAAAVQLAFNLVLLANPIGLIILALIGLVAALVTAYKTSATFRKIVDAAFRAVKTAALAVFNWIKSNWPLLLVILLGPIGAATALIIKNWAKVKAAAVTLWQGLKAVWRDGVAFVVRIFLGMVGTVLNAAARAFGWVPKIGDKLRAAARNFQTFRDQVNRALDGTTKPRKIKVTAELATSGSVRSGGRVALARGGPVFGPGTATSDSIPAMLSRGEHVLTARDVRAFGGHDAVMRMRKTAASMPGYAGGGPVIDPRLLGMAQFKSGLARYNKKIDAAAQKLAPAVTSTPFGGGGGVGRWLPVVLAVLAALGQPGSLSGAVLRRIAFESGGNPNAINLSDSNARAGHPSQGLVQTIPGTFLAYAGRYASRGITDPFANVYAGMNYALHRYGSIAAIDPLVRPRGYDVGGFLPPGLSLAMNGTGRPERVRTGGQEDALLREIKGLRRDVRSGVVKVDGRVLRREVDLQNARNSNGWG